MKPAVSRRIRKPLILLVQALVFCALLTAPAGASASFAAAIRSDPALCPMRTAASGYANAGRNTPAPAFPAHALPADAGRGHAGQTDSEQANSEHDHAGQAHSGQTHAEQAHVAHKHAAPAHAGQEPTGGGEAGHARHDASPTQENDCRCDPYSMSRCFSSTPQVLLSSGDAFIRPAQRVLHAPSNDTLPGSLHADNLFRPPRIPAA
ncbi:MAG: hypothetical protein LBR82_00075 [Desulfovibrio sp.]|nr:hypothetical protein [Desulfovibrio sp.]